MKKKMKKSDVRLIILMLLMLILLMNLRILIF